MDALINGLIEYGASSAEGFLLLSGLCFALLISVGQMVGGGYKRRAKRLHLIADGTGLVEIRAAAQRAGLAMAFFKIVIPVVLGLLWALVLTAVLLGA